MESNYININKCNNNVNITEDEFICALENDKHKFLGNGNNNAVGIITIKNKKCCYSYNVTNINKKFNKNMLKKRFDFDYIIKNTLYKFFFNYDQPIIYNRYLQDFIEGECYNSYLTIFCFLSQDQIKKDINDCNKYIIFFTNILNKNLIDYNILENTYNGEIYAYHIKKISNKKEDLKNYSLERIKMAENARKEQNIFLECRNSIDKIDKSVKNKHAVMLSLLYTGDDVLKNQIFKYNEKKTNVTQIIPIDLDEHPNRKMMWMTNDLKKYCLQNKEDIENAIKDVFGNKDLNDLTKLIEEDIRRVYNENNIKERDEDYKFLATLDDEIKKYTKKHINLVANNF